MDNIIDRAIYPLPEQEAEAKAKRRMGLGVTGVANALEAMGLPYGSPEFLDELDNILSSLANTAYLSSSELAKEKGKFPMWSQSRFNLKFADNLNYDTWCMIQANGLRNSHLLSIAPTGTISLTADNISSGIEPVFAHSFNRTLNTPDGVRIEEVTDYGLRVLGVKGKTSDQCTVEDHLGVLLLASKWVDSAVSKTCNVGPEVSFDKFKELYVRAYKGGAKGCTTFRSAGKRQGVLNTIAPQEGEGSSVYAQSASGAACYIDPMTGTKTCDN